MFTESSWQCHHPPSEACLKLSEDKDYRIIRGQKAWWRRDVQLKFKFLRLYCCSNIFTAAEYGHRHHGSYSSHSSLGNGKHVTHNTQALSFCFSSCSLGKLPFFICPWWKIRLDFSIFQLAIALELIPWLPILFFFASGQREKPFLWHIVRLSLESTCWCISTKYLPIRGHELELNKWEHDVRTLCFLPVWLG